MKHISSVSLMTPRAAEDKSWDEEGISSATDGRYDSPPSLHDARPDQYPVPGLSESNVTFFNTGLYNVGGPAAPRPHHGGVAGFVLTDEERADMLAFLEALTDDSFLTDPTLSDPFAP